MNEQNQDIRFLPPTFAELEYLSVIWEAQENGETPIQLGEVLRLINEKRASFGETLLAKTTVSTHLRNLSAKKLIAPTGGRMRKNPNNAYTAAQEPSAVLMSTLMQLAEAYPPAQRKSNTPILDMCIAMGIGKKMTKTVKALLSPKKK